MQNQSVITLGGGCYWCVDGCFRMLQGIIKSECGFSGGHLQEPKYKEVKGGYTGHAEVVQLTFDPEKLTAQQIIKHFFKIHDPTQLNRQGNDVGPMYRSIIFCHNDFQMLAAQRIINELEQSNQFDSKIVTKVQKFQKFWPAHDGHQDYYKNNPGTGYCRLVVKPKLDKYQKYLEQQNMLKSQRNEKKKKRECCRIL